MLRAEVEGGYLRGDPDRGRAAALLSGAPSYVVDAWDEWAALRSGACPWGDVAAEVDAAARACEWSADWLRPPGAGPGRQLDIREALDRAEGRMDRCGEVGAVSREGRHGHVYLSPRRCRARACIPCARRAMRRAFERFTPLFATAPRAGWAARFVTVGSADAVHTSADLRGYLRRVGRLVKVMREGSPARCIPARSWVGGLRALELLPRAEGGYAHVHLYVIRSATRYAYGYSTKRLEEHPELLNVGVRRVLRDLGLSGGMVGPGEVWREEVVRDGADKVASYMAKVASYMAKVAPDDADATASGWARRDIQETLRGARLVQGFGDAYRCFAGPDRTERSRDGRAAPRLRQLGRYDPRWGNAPLTDTDADAWEQLAEAGGTVAADLAPDFEAPEVTVRRVTRYRTDTLDGWREWSDIDAVRAGWRDR